MEKNKYKLGDLTEEYNEINVDGELNDVSYLQGINNAKYFQESNSNKNDIDLLRYKICRNNTFAYNKATSRNGEKISIAYRTDGDCLVSPSYICFKVIRKDLVLDDYLMLWFRRPVFDRYVRFNSWGSATEFFTYSDFAETEIELPSIEEQEKIVRQYKTIEDEIKIKEKINNVLEAQAYAIYKDAILNHEKSAKLSDIAKITMGVSPEGESFNTDGNGVVFYQGRTDFGFRFPTIRLYTTEPKRYADQGDILMSVRAPVGDVNIAKEHCAIGRGLASIKPINGCYSYLYYTMMDLNFELKKFNDEGTVFGSITKDDLLDLKVVSLSEEETTSFENKVSIIDKLIMSSEIEIQKLLEISSLLLSKLAD